MTGVQTCALPISDPDEEIELVEVTLEKALEMIKLKEIIDSKTITMIYLYATGSAGWE